MTLSVSYKVTVCPTPILLSPHWGNIVVFTQASVALSLRQLGPAHAYTSLPSFCIVASSGIGHVWSTSKLLRCDLPEWEQGQHFAAMFSHWNVRSPILQLLCFWSTPVPPEQATAFPSLCCRNICSSIGMANVSVFPDWDWVITAVTADDPMTYPNYTNDLPTIISPSD